MEWLIAVVIIGVIVLALLQAKLKNKPLGYMKRKQFLSAAERSFFGVLIQAVPPETRVLCKVRVADVLTPTKGTPKKNWQTAFNKISAKHFDYVLCENKTMSVIAAVELDDKSHQKKSRQSRDDFLNNACETASLPLIRFAAKKGYALQEIKDTLQSALNQSNKAPTSQAGDVTYNRGIKLSGEFEVTGLFYEANGYKFRKYLDIKRTDTEQNIPDLMVVMMNPGSSYPLDRNDNNSIPSKANPDPTQKQIMKVMKGASFDYARILNLSDHRMSDSNKFYKLVKSDESKLVDHSIFSDNRKAELNQLFIQNVPVIFGWGVNPDLVPLAKQAVDTLGICSPHGIPKPNEEYSYYHPLPKTGKKQFEWVQHVTSQCNTLGLKR